MSHFLYKSQERKEVLRHEIIESAFVYQARKTRVLLVEFLFCRCVFETFLARKRGSTEMKFGFFLLACWGVTQQLLDLVSNW
jgi:hypothetical protein